MVLNAGRKQYKVIREVFTGEINDVYVCRNQSDPTAAYKTVWIVKKREISKDLLRSFEKPDESVYEECFVQNENMCFVFPYLNERPLYKFYRTNIQNGSCSRQQIWLDFVVKCMTGKIQDSVLNLVLKQKQIQIGPDGKIWFNFFLDLSEYDFTVTEKENAALCAEKILELISLEKAKDTDAATVLLEKKLERNEYQEFILLFRDIKLIMKNDSDTDIKKKMKERIIAEQDRIYRILSCLCILLVGIVVIELLGHFISGEFFFWKLFHNSLEQIGTESLLQ